MFFGDKASQVEGCIKKKNSAKLIEMLDDKKSDIRIQAIMALGCVGDDRAVNALINLFAERDPAIRLAAVKSAGNIGNQAIKTHLQHLIQTETDEKIKQAIKDALSTIPNKN